MTILIASALTIFFSIQFFLFVLILKIKQKVLIQARNSMTRNGYNNDGVRVWASLGRNPHHPHNGKLSVRIKIQLSTNAGISTVHDNLIDVLMKIGEFTHKDVLLENKNQGLKKDRIIQF